MFHDGSPRGIRGNDGLEEKEGGVEGRREGRGREGGGGGCGGEERKEGVSRGGEKGEEGRGDDEVDKEGFCLAGFFH